MNTNARLRSGYIFKGFFPSLIQSKQTCTLSSFVNSLPHKFVGVNPLSASRYDSSQSKRRLSTSLLFVARPTKPDQFRTVYSAANAKPQTKESSKVLPPAPEDETIAKQPEKVRPQRPLILCHGLLGFDNLQPIPFAWASFWQVPYWAGGIPQHLRERGCQIYTAKVPATAHVAERAKSLRETILKFLESPAAGGNRSVNILGHSMGGLDARYLVSKLDGHQYVSSITTIGTPHRGSPYADFVTKNFLKRLRLERILDLINIPSAAFHCLTTHYLKNEFNPQVPDHPNVKYYSLGGARDPSQMPVIFFPGYKIILEIEGPNDGLVSVESSKWGEYIETLNCDHLEMINWHVRKYTSPFSLAPYVPFNTLDMYDRLATYLAQRGH